mgnify:FL=1
MTYNEWMDHVAKVYLQYTEGAITPYEVFNSIVTAALNVEQLPYDPAMPNGETNIVRDYNPEAGERIVP